MTRPFEPTDLPALRRYRQRGIFLNPAATLLWGPGLVPMWAAFSPVSDAVGIYTAVSSGDGAHDEPIIGQVRHVPRQETARFHFLSPVDDIDAQNFTCILEFLIKKLGEHKAQNLIAEVEESSRIFELLRKSGFAIYARQRIWRVERLPKHKRTSFVWREIAELDEFNVRKLYSAVVPTLVQQVEPPPWEDLRGWVLYQRDELMAYMHVLHGPRGIWVQPFIHPDMADVSGEIMQLLAHLRPRQKRPVYVCVRSYHESLTSHISGLGARPSDTQVVMVRRLTAAVKQLEPVRLPAINGNREPTIPYRYPVEEQVLNHSVAGRDGR